MKNVKEWIGDFKGKIRQNILTRIHIIKIIKTNKFSKLFSNILDFAYSKSKTMLVEKF